MKSGPGVLQLGFWYFEFLDIVPWAAKAFQNFKFLSGFHLATSLYILNHDVVE